MIIPDINILIYAVNKDSKYHSSAKKWFEKTLSEDEPVGLAWIVILGFLRIITSGKIMPRPLQPEAAYNIIETWFGLQVVQTINPTEQHWKILKELLGPLSTAGNLTSDAHLAALTIEHSACLYSTDNDFGRFKTLRWKNPL